jgi:hypothetical protein
MTSEQRRQAAAALLTADETATERAQAAALIVKQMKFRPKTVNGLDADRKARYFASVPEVPDELAARILIVYHLAAQRPMMGAFLDALGIAHDNGLIGDTDVKPDQTKLAAAATAIGKSFPPADVFVYLNTLVWQDSAAWGSLEGVPEAARPATS